MSMLPRREAIVPYEKPDGRLGLQIRSPEESTKGAKQSFKNECDINMIMKKYPTEEMRERLKNRPGIFADISTAPQYDEAMRVVARANEAFETLPARVRARFMNDPNEFLNFVHDGSNAEEMVKLGLMDKNAVERVTKERIAQKRKAEESSPKPKAKGVDKRSASESDGEEPTS